MNVRHSGWVYTVDSYKVENITAIKGDLVKKKGMAEAPAMDMDTSVSTTASL